MRQALLDKQQDRNIFIKSPPDLIKPLYMTIAFSQNNGGNNLIV